MGSPGSDVMITKSLQHTVYLIISAIRSMRTARHWRESASDELASKDNTCIKLTNQLLCLQSLHSIRPLHSIVLMFDKKLSVQY